MPVVAESISQKEFSKSASSEIKPGVSQTARDIASFWKEQRGQVDKGYKDWLNQSKEIIQRFRDERGTTINKDQLIRRFNALWANYKILFPAILSNCPQPVVERKFLDRDPKARLSAQILERASRNEIETNDLYPSLKRSIADYLLVGRGVLWVRYEPEEGEGESIPATYQDSMEDNLGDAIFDDQESEVPKQIPRAKNKETQKLNDTEHQLLNENTPVDYIDYRDFRVYPANARNWPEVQAIEKKVLLSKRQCIDRFGEEIGSAMHADRVYEHQDNSGPISEAQQTYRDINQRNIIVYETWNKIDRRIYWTSTGYEGLCDVKDDFLRLKDFFPVPEPIYATKTNDNMIPVPDFKEYQDQAIQLDELTQRIAFLTKACKVAGAYAAEDGVLSRLLDEAFENELIAVEDWAGLVEKGGIEGMIYFLPIDKIQEVIRTLTEVRQQVMQDMDLITGISDVIRGTTDSRETLGGIRLKNNNAGTRLADRQRDVANFAKDTIAIVAEIMAKHYDNETLIDKSGVMFLDEMQPETVIAELKQGKTAKQQLRPPQQKPISPAPMGGAGAPIQAQGQPQQPPMPMGQPPQNMPVQPPKPPQAPGQGLGMGMGLMPPGMGNAPQPQQSPEIMEQLQELLLEDEAHKIIQEKLEGALDLLREDVRFFYRIDIETDSTIFADADQEKINATEFLTAVTQFMEKASVIIQTMPQAMPLMGRMLQWGVRKFRVGRDLESSIDAFINSMEAMVKDLENNPKPNPEEMKTQADLAMKQQEMAHQQQLQQMEQQAQQANDQRDVMKAQMEDQRQQELNKMEMAMAQQKAQLEREKMELEKQLMLLKHKLETQKMHMEAQHQERSMQMESAHQQQTMQLKTQEAQTQHQIAMQSAQQQAEMQNTKHKQGLEAQQQKHKLGLEANDQKHKMAKEQAAMKTKQKPKNKVA